MRASCLVPDAGLVRLRSLTLNLANGTAVDAAIKTYANGTVDAKCNIRSGLVRESTSSAAPYCVGPRYSTGDIYVGSFTYGSAPVARYARSQGSGRLNGTVDFDVQNGCIP